MPQVCMNTKFFFEFFYFQITYVSGYIEQAPEHSYIDVNNYESVEELANYLKYLTKHTVSFVREYIHYIWYWYV